MSKLDSSVVRDFYNRSPESVAKDLLGKLLVRKIDKNYFVGRIVETEAYLSKDDAACHASRKMTKRNEPMFGPPGTLYIYFTYGMHWMLNVVTEPKGVPSAVLIRAIEPIYDSRQNIEVLKISERFGLGSGPARLTKWLGIDGNLNRIDIVKSKEIFVLDEVKTGNKNFTSEKISNREIAIAKRIGIDLAGDDAEKPLRFYIKDSKFVSKFI